MNLKPAFHTYVPADGFESKPTRAADVTNAIRRPVLNAS